MLRFSARAIRTKFQRFLRDARAATAIEYAMIASGVSIAIVATIVGLGANVKGLYTTVAAALN
ncbi:MAG: Flp family type IVb pilin [Xanthobacteraceae bacterium]|jgi:pilus assembly protein Flp/PilA